MFTRKIKILNNLSYKTSEFYEEGAKCSVLQEIPQDARTTEEKILSITTEFVHERKGEFGTTVVFYDASERFISGHQSEDHDYTEFPPENYSKVSNEELEMIKTSFGEYERAGNIIFLDINDEGDRERANELKVEIPEKPDIVIRRNNSREASGGASAHFPDNDPEHVQYYTINQNLDMLIETFGEERGTKIFLSNVLHETGHSIGLEHSFDDGQYGEHGFDDYVMERHKSGSIMDYTHALSSMLGITKDKLSKIDYLAVEKIYGKTRVEDSYEKYYQQQDELDAEKEAQRLAELNQQIDSRIEKAGKELDYINNNKESNPLLSKYFNLTKDGELSLDDAIEIEELAEELKRQGIKSDIGFNTNSIYIYQEGIQEVQLNGMEMDGIKPEHLDEIIALKKLVNTRTLTDIDEEMMKEIVKRLGDAEITIDTDENHRINSIKLKYLDKEYIIADKNGFELYGY